MEGLHCYIDTLTCDTIGLGLTLPVYEYFHADTGAFTGRSITAGYVYRGSSIPALQGKFVFGDFIRGKLWTFHIDGTDTIIVDHTIPLGISQQPFIVSFGRDGHGELHIVDYVGGKLYKIIPWTPPVSDCNSNFAEDSVDLLSGFSSDCNKNSIPDECDIASDSTLARDDDSDSIINLCDNCPSIFNPGQEDRNGDGKGDACSLLCGDLDENGHVTYDDLTYLLNFYFMFGDPPESYEVADVNSDGVIDLSDIIYLANYLNGIGPAPCAGSEPPPYIDLKKKPEGREVEKE